MENEEKCNENRCCGGRYGIWKCVGWCALGVIGFAAFALLMGFAIMWLWNCLVPAIFHGGLITFWQAVGLAILARLLFGGMHHKGWHRRGRCGSGRWHNHGKGCCNNRSDKWNHYQKFWEEEGEKSFNEYVEKNQEQRAKNQE